VKAAKVDKRKVNHHDSDTKSDQTVEEGSDGDNDPEEEAIWKVRLTGSVKPVLLIEPIQAMKASLPKAEEDEDDEDDEDVDDDDDVDDEDDSRADHSIQGSEFDNHAASDTDTEEDEEASSDAEDGININWEFDGVGFSDVDGSVNPDPLRTPVETYSV
jgi:hypothetical protein